jgi:hypothetical protein
MMLHCKKAIRKRYFDWQSRYRGMEAPGPHQGVFCKPSAICFLESPKYRADGQERRRDAAAGRPDFAAAEPTYYPAGDRLAARGARQSLPLRLFQRRQRSWRLGGIDLIVVEAAPQRR